MLIVWIFTVSSALSPRWTIFVSVSVMPLRRSRISSAVEVSATLGRLPSPKVRAEMRSVTLSNPCFSQIGCRYWAISPWCEILNRAQFAYIRLLAAICHARQLVSPKFISCVRASCITIIVFPFLLRDLHIR